MVVSLKSFDSAVKPVTSALTPGTAPIVAGTMLSRSSASAAFDLESVPLPTIGMFTWTTLRSGKVSRVIGGWNSELAFARATMAAIPRLTCGVAPFGELTTTTAGIPPPGKTFCIRLYVWIEATSWGSDSTLSFAVCRRNAGSARKTSRPAHRTREITGWRRTGSRIGDHTRLSSAFHGWCLRIGTPPFSTRSPSQDRIAGSTVSEPTMPRRRRGSCRWQTIRTSASPPDTSRPWRSSP